ncbi:hypothetical protein GN956_G18503 [Arapaima gigas]
MSACCEEREGLELLSGQEQVETDVWVSQLCPRNRRDSRVCWTLTTCSSQLAVSRGATPALGLADAAREPSVRAEEGAGGGDYHSNGDVSSRALIGGNPVAPAAAYGPDKLERCCTVEGFRKDNA